MAAEKPPRQGLKFAPREIFEKILEYAVIPTFDLVLEYGDQGVILVRRTIAPYKDLWALPGLRMYKPEDFTDAIRRIASDEVGLDIDPAQRVYLGHYDGKFPEEHGRQDLSAGFYFHVSGEKTLRINENHFSAMKMVRAWEEVPPDTGDMYRFYLQEFFRRRTAKSL